MNTINETSLVQKLRRTYIIALTLIALTLIGSQILVQNHLFFQRGLSETINKAGRQRMLSQRITKNILLATDLNSQHSNREEINQFLEDDLRLWQSTHKILSQSDKIENSPYAAEINALFGDIESHYQS